MSVFTVGAFAIILDEQQRVLLCHRRDRDLYTHLTHIQRIHDVLTEPDTLHMKVMPRKY